VPEFKPIKRNAVEAFFDILFATLLRESCKALGIPIVESVEKLNQYQIVIFVSTHDNYNEPMKMKEILLQKLESSKKTILGLEFYSDKLFEDLFNDPKRNLNDETFNKLISSLTYEKTIRGLIEAFNEIQQKYSRDRFEIKLFDMTYVETHINEKYAAIRRSREEKEKNFETRNAQILKNILDLLKTCGDNNLVVYTGTFHVIDLLIKLKEIIESGNKEEIKINNIIVFSPREDLKDIMRK